jgi:hypothetical protein
VRFFKNKTRDPRGRKRSTKIGIYATHGGNKVDVGLEFQSNGVFVHGYMRAGKHVRSHWRHQLKRRKKVKPMPQGKGI